MWLVVKVPCSIPGTKNKNVFSVHEGSVGLGPMVGGGAPVRLPCTNATGRRGAGARVMRLHSSCKAQGTLFRDGLGYFKKTWASKTWRSVREARCPGP